jgi:hypothetical protein
VALGAKDIIMLRYIFTLWLALSTIFLNIAMAKDYSSDEIWKLEIKDENDSLITTALFKFTDKVASSCIRGNWKVINIISSTSSDEQFFPVNQAISYDIHEGILIIGRNGRCDSYLHLTGKFKGIEASGKYTAFGIGHNKLWGSFSISIVKP